MGRHPDPLTQKDKCKRRIPLQTDPSVIKELMVVLDENGWTVELETTSLLFKKSEARLIYLRRLNILQIYWSGYGAQTIEAQLSDFAGTEDIMLWSEQLHDMVLIEPKRLYLDEDEGEEENWDEDQPLAELNPMDIIKSIFL